MTDPRLASKSVDWWSVHEFVVPLLNEVGSWPLAGSPLWVALDDNDPMKTAALYDAARHHALRVDTRQEVLAQTSREVHGGDDWRRVGGQILQRSPRIYIPRKKAS